MSPRVQRIVWGLVPSLLIAALSIAALSFAAGYFSRNLDARVSFDNRQQPANSPHEDCVSGAPSDCIRTSIEVARQKDFRGFHYCACVLSDGMAKAYLAADSLVHSVDDTAARAEVAEPLGNDNPAVNFPVGAKHR